MVVLDRPIQACLARSLTTVAPCRQRAPMRRRRLRGCLTLSRRLRSIGLTSGTLATPPATWRAGAVEKPEGWCERILQEARVQTDKKRACPHHNYIAKRMNAPGWVQHLLLGTIEELLTG